MQNSHHWRLLILRFVAVLAGDLFFSLFQPHFQIVNIESVNFPRLEPEPPRQQPLRLCHRLRISYPPL